MADNAAITVAGFNVRVDFGFVVFAGLLLLINPTTLGVWIVAAITVFTLLHELGHAFVARAFGAHAEISLGFMAGYTSYRQDPNRPLSQAQQMAVSAAGPLIQILVGSVVLVALGGSPVTVPSAASTDAQIALWWAGPVIGVLNLIPVLPLDGGHLVLHAATALFHRSMLRPLAIVSLALTAAAAVYVYVSSQRTFSLFLMFLLFSQYQILQGTRGKPLPNPKF